MQRESHENPPYIQFDSTLAIDLEAGSVLNNDHEESLTAEEWNLCLLLAAKWCRAPRSYSSAWYLAGRIYPSPRDTEIADPAHAIEQHISNIRRKLGEARFKSCHLVNSRGKGYKFCAQKGCSLSLIEGLLESVNKSCTERELP